MAQAGRLNQQTVRLALAQQGIQSDLHRQAIDAAHAATGDLFKQCAGIGEQCAVNADFAKLIHQYCPFLGGIFIG